MITTVIAAHMGSKRFPGKTLKEINGKSCLEHVVRAADRLNPVVATYNDKINEPIINLCRDKQIACFVYQGEPYDVLGRFYSAVQLHRPTARWVLRLTPDCPMLTHDLVMKFFFSCDYRKNTIYTNRPADNDGFDLETFPVEMLERAQEYASQPGDREHVTPWMYRHCRVERFSLIGNEVGYPEPDEKISIDTEEEFLKVKTIMEKCYEFSINEIGAPNLRSRA